MDDRHQYQYQQQQQQQQQHYYPVDEDSFSSEPTPVPNTYRPPPPTFQTATNYDDRQQQQQQQRDDGRHHQVENSLLESALLSLSVDDAATLPSLALDPPSPLSRPSESLLINTSIAESEYEREYTASTSMTPINAKKVATTPTTTLSLARSRRKQQLQKNTNGTRSAEKQNKHNKSNNTAVHPIQEVIMDDNNNEDDENNQDNTSTVGEESDTFFECLSDRSLANRARRNMRSDGPSSYRSLLSSPDGQPNMPKQRNAMIQHNMHNNTQTGSSVDEDDRHLLGRQGHRRSPHHRNNFSDSISNNNRNDIGSDDVVRVHESALHALQQLKEELVKSNQRNEQLSLEKESWTEEQQQLRQKLTSLQTVDRQRSTELDRLRQDHDHLQQDHKTIEKQRDELVEEKRNLEFQSREAARTTKELRHRTLAADNRHKELKGQLDKLNDELETALSAKGNLAAELARAQTERMDLETESAEIRKKLSDATSTLKSKLKRDEHYDDQLRIECKNLQELRTSSDTEIGRLNTSLRKANDALHRLRAELTPKVRSAVRHMTTPSLGQRESKMTGTGAFVDGGAAASSSLASSSLVPPSTLDSAIADRLARLRDSAERAHLIRGHKREIARLKADRDATIEKLENNHSDALKKAAKQFNVKRKSELEDLTQNLKQQHESHLEDVEEEHRKRISQLQKDHARSQEESDESLEEALSRVARLVQDHKSGTARRQTLERTLEDLNQKMRTQQKESQAQHVNELDKRRREWESEKETLLGNLQRDCNVVFDNRRRTGADVYEGGNNNSNNINNNTTAPRSTISPRYLNTQQQHPPSIHQGQRHPSQQQQQQQHQGPSPLSMHSAMFFHEEKNTVDTVPNGTTTNSTTRGTVAVLPSPGRISSPTVEMVGGTGSPSIISKSYSDIDSVLRETEELVNGIL
jgi:hypothetical protein